MNNLKSNTRKGPWQMLCVDLQEHLIFVKVTVAVMKQHYKKKLGEEKVYVVCTSTSQFIIEGRRSKNSVRTKIWREELMQVPQRNTVHSCATHDFLSLRFIELRVTKPEVAPSTMD